ncbi:MAG: hypothetical protein PHD61_12970 [Bacteroidales bacterium]|nr:hypothetical protein [Bacteroidales bacterium]
MIIISLTPGTVLSSPRLHYPYTFENSSPADTIKLLDSLYAYFWRTQIGYWVNEDLDLFYYDHNTRLIKWNRKHWDESYGYLWYDDYRVLYTIENGLTVEELKQEYDRVSQLWTNYSLFTYEYDLQGNRTEWKWQRWSSDANDWNNFRLNQYLYNNANQPVQSVSMIWDTDVSSWVYSQKIETLYNSTGNDSIILTCYWSRPDSAWSNLSKKTNLYDFSGNLIHVVTQVWVDELDAWINSSNSLSVYDNNNILETVNQHWNTVLSDWEDKTRTVYSYNELGQISFAAGAIWDKADSLWKNTTRSIYEYDRDGDMVDVVLQNWTADQEWQNTSRNRFVYMKVLSIPEGRASSQVTCKWTALSSEVKCARCEGLKDDEPYLFSLFSMQGSNVFSQYVKGDQTFFLRGGLPAGIYVLIITDDHSPVYQEKVFIP